MALCCLWMEYMTRLQSLTLNLSALKSSIKTANLASSLADPQIWQAFNETDRWILTNLVSSLRLGEGPSRKTYLQIPKPLRPLYFQIVGSMNFPVLNVKLGGLIQFLCCRGEHNLCLNGLRPV